MNGCPDPEQLAALIDGRASPSERADLQRHLASCEDCYQIFSGSALYVQETAAPARVPPRARHWKVVLPLAAAAALVLAIFAPRWTGERPLPSSIPTATAPSGTVSRDPIRVADPLELLLPAGTSAPAKALGAAFWRERPAGYGFAPAGSLQRAAMLLGVHTLDLDLAWKGADPQNALDPLERIADVLAGAGRADAARAYRDLEARLNGKEGPPTDWAPPPATELARTGFDPDWIEAGRWLEAARLAAAVRQTALFEDERARQRVMEALSRPTSPAIARKRAALRDLLTNTPRSEADWEGLERTLADVLRLI